MLARPFDMQFNVQVPISIRRAISAFKLPAQRAPRLAAAAPPSHSESFPAMASPARRGGGLRTGSDRLEPGDSDIVSDSDSDSDSDRLGLAAEWEARLREGAGPAHAGAGAAGTPTR
uniref:Uncharacterized protein n=1 Tax=Cryptomonas curvata TaxID=233186 RepID=A0A7S0QD82_9CRYP